MIMAPIKHHDENRGHAGLGRFLALTLHCLF